MGSNGPCGVCTEIHYAHNAAAGPELVNAGTTDVVEVWNLVFIGHNRCGADGAVTELAAKHVDTGLGLERLAAIKAGSTSNYDTEAFRPLFAAMERVSGGLPPYSGSFDPGNEVDFAYRAVADHMRMLAVCVADGAHPDSNHRVRNVGRRMLRITRNLFREREAGAHVPVLNDLAWAVTSSLGEQYPELERSGELLQEVIGFENDLYAKIEAEGEKLLPRLREEFPASAELDLAVTDVPQIYQGASHLAKQRPKVDSISPEAAVTLFKNLGVQGSLLRSVSRVAGVPLQDESEIESALADHKAASKGSYSGPEHDLTGVPMTNDSYKYTFSTDGLIYHFPLLTTKCVALFDEAGERVKALEEGQKGTVYLDSTCFYARAGGQDGDRGYITSNEKKKVFTVEETRFAEAETDQKPAEARRRYVAHVGVANGPIAEEDAVKVRVKLNVRIALMQNHTGTHLLNSVLHALYPLTSQKSSHVTADEFRLDFSVLSAEFDNEILTEIERRVNMMIEADEPVVRKENEDLAAVREREDVISIPGEHYPDRVSLVELPDGTAEPCCGTHVVSTGHLQSFAVVGSNAPAPGLRSLRCVTGARAKKAREDGISLIEAACKLAEDYAEATEGKVDKEVSPDDLNRMKIAVQRLNTRLGPDKLLPHTVRVEIGEIVSEISEAVYGLYRVVAKVSFKAEIAEMLDLRPNPPYLAHGLGSPSAGKVNLYKLAKDTQKKLGGKPVLLVGMVGGAVSGKALVPDRYVKEGFNAKLWLETVATQFGAKVTPPKGQDPDQFCSFKCAVVQDNEFEELLERGISEAKNLADEKVPS